MAPQKSLESKGATVVVTEDVQGISRARGYTGMRHARMVMFLYLSTLTFLIPESLVLEIYSVMSDPICVGGGVDVDYHPKRHIMRLYLGVWRVLGRLTDMVQGSTQFCRKEVFEEVGGYDETGVDRRGRGFLLGSQEARQAQRRICARDTRTARAAVYSSFR